MDIDELDKEERIKKWFWIALAVLFVLVVISGTLHYARSLSEFNRSGSIDRQALERLKADRPHDQDLKMLENYMFGVKFLGHFSWISEEVKDKMILYHIKDSPKVDFMIFKFDADMILIDQLSRYRLENMGLYAKDFAMERTEVAGRKAIKVKAYAKDDPDTRLLHYYILRWDNYLMALMFSVSPKSEWDRYQYLFQDIVDSFEFIW